METSAAELTVKHAENKNFERAILAEGKFLRLLAASVAAERPAHEILRRHM
jgi:hypothetical protein